MAEHLRLEVDNPPNPKLIRKRLISGEEFDLEITELEGLKGFAGGGTLPSMEPASKEYVDLKLDAVMTRIDGKFDMLNQRLGDLEKRTPSLGAIIATAFTSGIAIVGVLLAALAFGGDRFDSGIGLADQRQEQLQIDAAQSAIIKRLDSILESQLSRPTDRPADPPAEPSAATGDDYLFTEPMADTYQESEPSPDAN